MKSRCMSVKVVNLWNGGDDGVVHIKKNVWKCSGKNVKFRNNFPPCGDYLQPFVLDVLFMYGHFFNELLS